jgi:transposase-like protein
LLVERGIQVDHVTVYRWVQRFTPLLTDAARSCRHVPGDRWFVDATYVKVAGRWVYLYRAVDQFDQVIDVLVSQNRDLAATRRFFTRALQHGSDPTEVTTDRGPAYPRVIEELIPAACHQDLGVLRGGAPGEQPPASRNTLIAIKYSSRNNTAAIMP